MPPAVALRDEQDADEAFVAALFAASRADEMARVPWPEPEKARFLRGQFALQRRHYRTHYDNAIFSIVLADGVPIGRFYVQRGAAGIVLMEITLLPDWQKRGIGSALLRGLLDEAAALGKPVALHVAQTNPARGWYLRLGFRMAATVGVYDRLEWSGAPAPAHPNHAEHPG